MMMDFFNPGPISSQSQQSDHIGSKFFFCTASTTFYLENADITLTNGLQCIILKLVQNSIKITWKAMLQAYLLITNTQKSILPKW